MRFQPLIKFLACIAGPALFLQETKAACPAHIFETTYYSSLNSAKKGHAILKSTFAMDLTSLDMVVGGSIKMLDDKNEKLFLYLAEE